MKPFFEKTSKTLCQKKWQSECKEMSTPGQKAKRVATSKVLLIVSTNCSCSCVCCSNIYSNKNQGSLFLLLFNIPIAFS